jgi:hypothetical protein
VSKFVIIILTIFRGKSGAKNQGINQGERRLAPAHDRQAAAPLGTFLHTARPAPRNWSRHQESPVAVTPGPGKQLQVFTSQEPPEDPDLSPGRKSVLSPLARGMATPPGMSLFFPHRGPKELSTKPGAMILNAWNSQKIITFFENPLLLFRLKVRSSKAPSLSQPTLG